MNGKEMVRGRKVMGADEVDVKRGRGRSWLGLVRSALGKARISKAGIFVGDLI
jgi:hypothetical protein